MLIQWRDRSYVRRAVIIALLTIGVLSVSSSVARAQEQERSSFLGDVFKHVVLDPTTYAPAIISYDATMRDWNSSQPFFASGYVERNPRFTISGRPNDIAVPYDVGHQRILRDSFAAFQVSLVNNTAMSIFERALVERYPEHRKLVRTLAWVERIGFGGYLTYRLSAQHYQQAALNDQAARQYGLR